MKNITQTVAKSNTFNTSIEYIGDFMSNLDFNLKDHRISGILRPTLMRQILNGSNEQAYAVLSSIGIIKFVPGIGDSSIPLNEFANFYGVSEQYLRSLLTRNGFVQKDYPYDISRWSRRDILAGGAQISPHGYRPVGWGALSGCAETDLVEHAYNGTCNRLRICLPESVRFNAYSPRLVLAVSLLMGYTDKSPHEGNIEKTMLAIKRGPYRFVCKEEPTEVKQEETSIKDEPANAVQVTSAGEFLVSPELLTHVVKTAVKEAASEILSESRDNQQKKRGKV